MTTRSLPFWASTVFASPSWSGQGDTIRARVTVLEKRETSRPQRGIMKRQLQVLNQRGEVVQEGVQAFLLKRKPS